MQEVFRDPHLQALIRQALAYNRDLQLATARVAEARALYASRRLAAVRGWNSTPPLPVAVHRQTCRSPGKRKWPVNTASTPA